VTCRVSDRVVSADLDDASNAWWWGMHGSAVCCSKLTSCTAYAASGWLVLILPSAK